MCAVIYNGNDRSVLYSRLPRLWGGMDSSYELLCKRELGNVVDRYAIAVKKPDSDVTVGHLPKKFPEFAVCLLKEGVRLQPQLRAADDIRHFQSLFTTSFLLADNSEFAEEIAAEGITLDNGP